MILLPLTPDPVATPVAPAPKAPEQAVLKVLVLGFTPSERKLLDGVIGLSRRRTPRIELLDAAVDAVDDASIIMIDTTDAQAMAWASIQTGLQSKTVIWVDGRSAPAAGHTLIKRPVQWPLLPTLLMQAVDRGLEHSLASVRGALHSRPMSVF